MTGSVIDRGNGRWLLKWDLPRAPGEKRQQRYKVIQADGIKAARKELRAITGAIDAGRYVDPSRRTLNDCIDDWLAAAELRSTAKTMERYREIAKNQIRPKLGGIPVQKLTHKRLNEHYAELLKTLSPRTVNHAHRIVFGVLKRAAKDNHVMKNVAFDADRPKVPKKKQQILNAQQITAMLNGLRDTSLYLPVAVLVSTGLRRGELCGLRWDDVDIDHNRLRVDENIEQTKEHGSRAKDPKTEDGARTVAIPPSLSAELKAYWKDQAAKWFTLTGQRLPNDRFVFGDAANNPRSPNGFTREFKRAIAKLKLPKISPHALRHTHASQLIAAGIDVVRLSKRLGHSDPEVTLRVYSHLFDKDDTAAADVMERALSATLIPRQ